MGYALLLFFFFNDTATTEIYTLSLHDALPISTAGSFRTPCRPRHHASPLARAGRRRVDARDLLLPSARTNRSEEHTSELQSRLHLVCRLLLGKKKQVPRCATSPNDIVSRTRPS